MASRLSDSEKIRTFEPQSAKYQVSALGKKQCRAAYNLRSSAVTGISTTKMHYDIELSKVLQQRID